jgi:tetratricopeptide (TPR) repeat protein
VIGTTLGPYRIDRELGAGGMGKVYRATATRKAAGLEPDTTVALKIVHAHLLETEGFFKRFLREAEVGKRIVHENVVRTIDCDQIGSSSFLVMEYVQGQTLRSLLAELDRVPEELCRHIGREVAKGLAAIHAAGVIHRDMKPENVLITAEHVVKVMDLGVARLNDEALRLSQTGAFVGSIHYAAPECFSEGGKHVDGRADLHALGLVLYELACGTNPYQADDVPTILKKVLHEEPRRLGDVNPQLSPFFEEVVHCLLAKKPEDRFATASELLGVLEEGEKSDWWKARAKAIRAVTHQPLRRIRIPRETAVYGREQDLAKLTALYGKAKAGEGQVVVIEGEAGIGKSRVVDELIGRLQRDGEELNFLFGSYPPGGAATAAGAFSTAFREQFGSDGSAAYLTPSPILVPAFDALLKGEPTPTGVESLTKDSLQTCFVHATRGLAAERTTVLLIDDLHFATEDARSLFTSLAMAVPGHRILLVGTTRPGIDEKWLAGLTRLPQTSQMSLHRLGPKDLAALLKDSLKSETLALSLAGQIGEKSDGNPFFVFEIIRGLRDGQFLTQRDDGTWVSTRVIDDIKIPSSILDLVNARVADLTEEERDLLDVACCWGFEFDPGLIGEVLGVGRIPLLKRFGQIERQHRLVRASGRNYCFDHHQVQEALYGSLHEQMREEYHSALATALETRTKAADQDPTTLDGALCVDLCEHFLRGSASAGYGAERTGTVPDARTGAGLPGGESGSAQGERALRYLASALTHLEKGYLNDAAIRLCDRVLAVPGLLAGAERAKTLLRLSGVLSFLGRRKRAEEAACEAALVADAAADDALRGHAAMVLGGCFYRTARFAESETSYRRSQEIARSRGDRSAEAGAEIGLANVFHAQGRHAESREHVERALTLSRDAGDRELEAIATGNLGNHFQFRGCLVEAQEHIERGLALSREIGDRVGESRSTGNLGAVVHALGRPAEAREHQERCLAMTREIGDRRTEAIALHNLAGALWELGELESSKERYRQTLSLCEEIGFAHLAAASQLALGALSRELRDDSGARDLWARSLESSSQLGTVGVEALTRLYQANLPGGDVRSAETFFRAHEGRLSTEERIQSRWLLWKAIGERSHLVAAKLLLDESLAKVPAEHHAAMLANVRVNREIAAAAKAAGL